MIRNGEMIDGAASELLKNESMHVGRAQCMAIWNSARQEVLFTDSLRGALVLLIQNRGTYLQKNLERKIQKIIERDVSDGLFAQPTGIYVEWNTFIVVDSLLRS